MALCNRGKEDLSYPEHREPNAAKLVPSLLLLDGEEGDEAVHVGVVREELVQVPLPLLHGFGGRVKCERLVLCGCCHLEGKPGKQIGFGLSLCLVESIYL